MNTATILPSNDEVLSHHIDTIRLALSPYCCGPGESFRLEPIRDNCSYTHDNTYLWLDMTWERLRGHYGRAALQLIHDLCKNVLDGPTLNRIVMMTGQAPAKSGIKDGCSYQEPVRYKAPPLVEYMEQRATQRLPLLPSKYSLSDQEDMVPVTRPMKNGVEVVIGWRKPNGPMVVSFDPIVSTDEVHNRKRRMKRKAARTAFGGIKKLERQGRHEQLPRKLHSSQKCNTTHSKAG